MRKVFYSISICLVLFTPFLYSNELYNGVISAKQIWFYGAMACLMLVTALDLLFDRKPFTIQLNKIDLALLAFFTYYTIRAATTPYMPLLHNQRWINWGLCVVLYFVIKRIGKIWTDGGHSRANGGQALSGNGHTIGENSHTVVIHGHTVVVHGHTSSEDESNDAQQTTTPENHLTTPDNCMAMPDAKRMTTYDNIHPNDTKQLPLSNNRMTTHDAKRMTTYDRISSYIINFLILTALCQSLWGLLQLYGFLPSFNGYFKITGTFFNPAPYAMYLAIIFPMALGKVLYYQHKQNEVTLNANPGNIFKFSNHQIFKSFKDLVFKFPHYMAFATVLAILLILPATMIRAAWLAAAVGALVVAWPWLKTHTPLGSWLLVLGSRLKYKIIAITAAIALIGAIGTGLFYLKKDSANGKLFIWEVTLGKIAQKPLFGYGVGRFEAEYNNWQAEYFMKHPVEMDGPKGWVAGNTKYAFNEFLEMTSETGIIGVVLFIHLIVLFIQARTLLYSGNALSLNFLLGSYICLLLCMIISFPLFSLPTKILFILFLALSSVSLRTKFYNILSSKFLKYLIFLLLVILGTTTGIKAKKEFDLYFTFDEAHLLFQSGNFEEACISFEEVNPDMRYNGLYLIYYGKSLNMAKRYHESNSILKQGEKFTADEILYSMMGDNYKALNKYTQTETAYQKAIYIEPNKFNPMYVLAKLYLEKGDTLKASNLATKILQKPVKVKSQIVENIKEEMKTLLKLHNK